ncbi:MAG: L-threonylcarbamoyladenylate synthase [Bdellovibrionales bacterium]
MDQITSAIHAFLEGKLVGLPTETVYGLAAPYNQTELIKKIFSIKERPLFDPLIVHVSQTEQAKSLVKNWCLDSEKLSKAFWPGPLTIVTEKSEKIDDLITSGLDTVAIRCPEHPVALDFLNRLNCPVVAPSANKFKKTSPTQKIHVTQAFSEEEVFCLEGGESKVGIESTIVKILGSNKIAILRPGMILKDEIEALGFEVVETEQTGIEAPGNMEDHYMPEKNLFLFSSKNREKLDNHLFTEKLQSYSKIQISNSPHLAARELYSSLRETTAEDCMIIEISEEQKTSELWVPIIDRLKKAASKSFL